MLAGMTSSAELFARAVEAMPGGNTRSTLYIPPVPPYARRGEGCRLEDEDGHVSIDLQLNYTTLVHGHGHPSLLAAATAAMADGTCFGLPSRHDVALAERICERVPAVDRLRFANSGSEAVMMAVRTARAFTGRDAVLRFAGSYHGIYDAALDESAPGLTAAGRSELVTVGVADGAGFLRALDADGDRLACVIIDLMPNRAGLEPVPADFAALVRRETAARGILLICDEVITLRLETGGLQVRYGLRPDLVTMGKIIGGGFAVGAWGGRADVMAILDPRTGVLPHAGTFSANPVTCAAGLVALDLLDAPAIARLNAMGDDLRERVAALGYRVAGSGSLFRLLDLLGDVDGWRRLYGAGLLVATNGLCSLSTVMMPADVDEVERRFAAAKGPGPFVPAPG
jgi:glutamate-1-semialdehyde 2,1-aminomutase